MSNRKMLIAGNWKMYKTTAEAEIFASGFIKLRGESAASMAESRAVSGAEFNASDKAGNDETEPYENTEIAICAPFTQLTTLKNLFEGTKIGLGAQNVHYENEGAFTGEISLPMLKEIGLDYCIVGHSERRMYFNETDETISRKLLKLLNDSNIKPILCIGENLEERERGIEKQRVEAQLKADLNGICLDDIKKMTIAYEPIWAIGTGKTATPDQAEEMCECIRKTTAELYNEETAEAMTVLYGGSVKPENAKDILSRDNIDGALVGGASLDPDKFNRICQCAE